MEGRSGEHWHSPHKSANITRHRQESPPVVRRGGAFFEDEEAGELATKVVPLTDHIVLQPIEGDEVTVTGLVIPDSAKEKPQQGAVVAVGPGKMNDAGVVETMELSAGDRVLYQQYAGTKVQIEKVDYIVVRFADVLARLDQNGTE